MNKYKKTFQVEEKIKEQKEQEELHKKYADIDPDVKIIEKSNMAKFTVRMVGRIIQIIAQIAIIIFAIIGVLSLIYPDTRASLIGIKDEIILQLKAFLPL